MIKTRKIKIENFIFAILTWAETFLILLSLFPSNNGWNKVSAAEYILTGDNRIIKWLNKLSLVYYLYGSTWSYWKWNALMREIRIVQTTICMSEFCFNFDYLTSSFTTLCISHGISTATIDTFHIQIQVTNSIPYVHTPNSQLKLNYPIWDRRRENFLVSLDLMQIHLKWTHIQSSSQLLCVNETFVYSKVSLFWIIDWLDWEKGEKFPFEQIQFHKFHISWRNLLVNREWNLKWLITLFPP